MTKLVTFNLNSSPIKASTNNYSYTEKTNPMNIHTSDNAYTGADYNYIIIILQITYLFLILQIQWLIILRQQHMNIQND